MHQRGEVVVGEDELAGLLGDLRAASHGDADVGLLQRGGVVDRVAGHRHHLARLLHQPGQTDLVFGGDPTEHVQLRELLYDLLVAEVGKFGTGDHAGSEAELVGDRAGGDGVVTGDHPDIDTSRAGDAYRVNRLRSQG